MRILTSSMFGVRGSVYCTAVGKAILAFLPEEEREEYLRCVGAATWNSNGQVIASLSVSGPSQRHTLTRIASIAPMSRVRQRRYHSEWDIDAELGIRGSDAKSTVVGLFKKDNFRRFR